MSLRHVLQRILSVLVPLSIIATVYLYLYPLFHGCAFPLSHRGDDSTPSSSAAALLDTIRDHIGLPSESHATKAPFRLLVLADPQIEGDSSLPGPDDGLPQRLARYWRRIRAARTASVRLERIKKSARDTVTVDIPRSLSAARKRLDLFGNDFYLAHIYRTLRWWAGPTHVTVLGDLVGSQWVADDEFEARSWRYWNRVLKGGVRVEDDITVTGSEEYDVDEARFDPLRLGDAGWSNRIINVAGNHDVGYAGDITEARMERFDREFGRANWDVRFEYDLAGNGSDGDTLANTNPSIHLIVLNSLAFDSPALTPSVQTETYTFLNDLITHRSGPVEDRSTFTLLLTHLPLHKKQGVCTDAPYFSFHSDDDEKPDTGTPRFKAGGLKEQNHLSDYLSHGGILQGVFGMSGSEGAPAGGRGRNGLILTGHDHTGCDVVHFVDHHDQEAKQIEDESSKEDTPDWTWDAQRYSSSSPHDRDIPSVREVTLRSMMGEYGGYAGLLSVWFDSDPSVREWKYEITMCSLGVQHIWWAVHAVWIVTIVLLLVWMLLGLFNSNGVFQRKDLKSSGDGSDKAKQDVAEHGDPRGNARDEKAANGLRPQGVTR